MAGGPLDDGAHPTCPECGRDTAGSSWCGGCGARVIDVRGAPSPTTPGAAAAATASAPRSLHDPVVGEEAGENRVGPAASSIVLLDGVGGHAVDDEPRPAGDDPVDHSRRPRGWLVAAAAVAAVAAVAAGLGAVDGDRWPSGTVGHLDRPPDLVADGPLPDVELRLAWELPTVPEPIWSGGFGVGAVRAVGDDGRLVAADLVIDPAVGEVVGSSVPGVELADGTVVHDDGNTLVVWDVATGTVVGERRVDLPDGWTTFAPRAAFEDGTLLGRLGSRADQAGPTTMATVAPDGAVTVVDFDAWPRDVLGERFALINRIADDGIERLEWVDVTTDERTPFGTSPDFGVATVRAGDQVVRADGEGLLAFSPSGLVRVPQVGSPATPLAEVAVLGEIAGGLVVAGRLPDNSWQLARVPLPIDADVSSTTTSIVDLPRGTLRRDGGGGPSGSGLGVLRPGDVAVVDDLVVVLDQLQDATLVALDVRGRVVWTRPTADDGSMAAAGGHVVVLAAAGDGQQITVVDPADGSEVMTTVGAAHTVAPRIWWTNDGLVGTTTGQVALDARFGDVAGPDRRPSASVVGIVPDPTTGEPTLLTRDGAQRLRAGDDVIDPSVVADVAGDRRLIGYEDGAALYEVYDTPSAATDRPENWLAVVMADGTSVRHDGLFGGGWWSRGGSGRVLAGADRDGLVLFDPSSGGVRLRVPDAYVATRASADRLVVVGPGGWWIVDDSDGSTVGQRRPMLGTLPSVGDGLVAWSRPDGALEVVETLDGATSWIAEDAPVAPASIGFAGDHVLVGTRDGRVVQYDAAGGFVRELDVGEGLVAGIGWEDGTLVVQVDGTVRGWRADGDGIAREDRVEVP